MPAPTAPVFGPVADQPKADRPAGPVLDDPHGFDQRAKIVRDAVGAGIDQREGLAPGRGAGSGKAERSTPFGSQTMRSFCRRPEDVVAEMRGKDDRALGRGDERAFQAPQHDRRCAVRANPAHVDERLRPEIANLEEERDAAGASQTARAQAASGCTDEPITASGRGSPAVELGRRTARV